MSNYETSLKASLDNLSNEEISKKLKTGYFSDEAREVAEQVLNERGFASNESTEKIKEVEGSESSNSSYLTPEQNKKFMTGNVVIWMIGLFLFGASQYSTYRDIPAFLFFQGLFYAIFGTIIHLIYLKIKKKTWTLEELRKKYRSNFKTALFVIGLALLSTIVRIFFNLTSILAWLDLVVLSVILAMYLKSANSAKNALAIYSLIPVAVGLIFGVNGNIIIWAFGFFVAAQSILINDVINPEGSEST